MRITGKFLSAAGETVEVEISIPGAEGDDLEIGDGVSGLWFAGEGSVETKGDVSDTFDHIFPQTATIHLLADRFVPELYQLSGTGAVVNVRRGGSCVFAGYVEPRTYSQEFNSPLDALDVNCRDCLSCLERRTYMGAGGKGSAYSTAKQSARQRTLLEILEECLGGLTAGLDLKYGEDPPILYDGSRAMSDGEDDRYAIFGQLTLPDALFLGDGADDVWDCKSVVEGILRWLNLRMVEDGLTFYIYDLGTAQCGGEVSWQELRTGRQVTTRVPEREIGLGIAGDTDTRLSVGEAYSRISAKCDVKRVDSAVESPLEEDSLTSPYASRQLYCSEYMAGYKAKLWAAVRGDNPLAAYDGVTIRHWIVRVMENPRWRFPYGDGTRTYAGVFCGSGKGQYLLPRALSQTPGAGILKVSTVEQTGDSSDDSAGSLGADAGSVCLVVSVNGGGEATAGKDTEAAADAIASALKSSYPRAEYTGSGGTLSPPSADATNYIVISGNITLVPLQEETGSFHDIRALTDSGDMGDKVERKGGKRYYTRRYWETEDATGRTYTDKEAAEDAQTDKGLEFFGGDCPQSLSYKYSGKWDTSDRYSKIGVLACMLVVGGKCAVEVETSRNADGTTRRSFGGGDGDSEKSRIEWRDYKTLEECKAAHPDDAEAAEDEYFGQSFTIGFNPKIGDYLVGTEFAIQDNVTWDMDIDAHGTAIPITQADGVGGDVRFTILGPVNVMWDEVTRRHPTFFRHTKWSTTTKPLMAHVANIVVRDFSMKVYSDNAHATADDDDIVYTSDTDRGYYSVRDDIELKVHSALTSEEALRLGVSLSPCLSVPTVAATGQPVTEVYDRVSGGMAKPERIYIDAAWRDWHEPRVMLEQTLRDTSASRCGLMGVWRHPALAGKLLFTQSLDRDLMAGEARVTLRECGDASEAGGNTGGDVSANE